MRMRLLGLLTGAVLLSTGCPTEVSERNPFLTFSETFGLGGSTASDSSGSSGGSTTQIPFRESLTLTFVNSNAGATLDTSFVAWVELSSVRSTAQQDALFRGGYVQLTRAISLGTAYTLPVGTFVYNGPGTAGATPVRLGSSSDPNQTGTAGAGASSVTYTLTTPDVILMYSQPPVSCDSVAFSFLDPATGAVLTGPATGGGGYKTLAQVDVYECTPFRPGLFFNVDGGQAAANEFDEGQTVTFTFLAAPVGQAFATVQIGTATTTP